MPHAGHCSGRAVRHRSMRRSPGSTTIQIVLIAVSIGLACSAFAVTDAVLFRSLPAIAEPDRLVLVSGVSANNNRVGHPLRVYEYLAGMREGTSHIFAYRNYGALPGTIGTTTATATRHRHLRRLFRRTWRRAAVMWTHVRDQQAMNLSPFSATAPGKTFSAARPTSSAGQSCSARPRSPWGVAPSDFVGTHLICRGPHHAAERTQ